MSKRVPLDANPATAHMFIIKHFSAGGLMGLFSTHPPTVERVERMLARHGRSPEAVVASTRCSPA